VITMFSLTHLPVVLSVVLPVPEPVLWFSWDLVADPLGLRFFVLGLLASVLAVGSGGLLSPVAMLRQEAYLTQGIGQSMVAGAAVGALVDLGAAPGGFLSALLAAALVSLFSRARFVSNSSAVAVVSSLFFAAGVALISADRERGINVSNLLFGNILGVSPQDLLILSASALLAGFLVARMGRRFVLCAASDDLAQVHGVPVKRLEFLRLCITAATVAASVQVVGVSLSVVALTVPYLVAAPFVKRLGGLLAWSTFVGAFIGTVGMYVSYYADIPSGPAIVMVSGLLLLVSKLVEFLRK
jgi:ABC-type Mn2+/Zn2+ transport system permease subunit